MPKVILAEVAGFCFGVQRAVDLAAAARRERYGKLTSLGPIIHNPQVIEKMAAEGVGAAQNLDEIGEGTVIMSAHGVAPSTLEAAKAKGLDVLDVTCPFVTKVHRTAQQLIAQGYQLILVGDHGHTEVQGIVGAVEGNVTVVSSPEELRGLKLARKVGIVSQTTQKAENFAAVVAEVCKSVFDVRAYNTICNATDELQEAAEALARQVDVVIVVGGRKSANTRRLRDTCAKQGVPAYQVETAEEVVDAWLEGKETVGVTAGASTPDWLIEAVVRRVSGGAIPEGLAFRHPDEKTLTKFFGLPHERGRETVQAASSRSKKRQPR